MDDLASWNDLKPPYVLSVGQTLRLAPPSQAAAQNGRHTTAPTKVAPVERHSDTAAIAPRPRSASGENAKPIAATAQKDALDLKKRVTKWVWPVKGKIIGRFSPRRGGNKGIDLLTPGPQPVKAAADGWVVYAGEGLRGYGKLVIVKHNKDYLSAYAYNSALRVKEKQNVKAGEVIADTGWDGLYANQLHFEVRYRGKPVDPLKFLKR